MHILQAGNVAFPGVQDFGNFFLGQAGFLPNFDQLFSQIIRRREPVIFLSNFGIGQGKNGDSVCSCL